ncbi:class II aldolase/adducin family protein [Herbiconiux sp.]|uniref:class II aldolase/adducin family protein n=1 Tax=Herbiconiux sp. TaxID=1871186 RepID=UPI0025C5412A|nr:class II aldolase/adducin family protein [Herbiconiux sp.]
MTEDSAVSADARRQLVELSRELGRPDRAWAVLAEGNTSVAVDEGRMLVKASGASMAVAEPADFVPVRVADVLALVDAPDSAGAGASVGRDAGAAGAGDGAAPGASAGAASGAPGESESSAAGDEAVRALFATASTGGRRPSVEALLHAVCLDLPGVEAVGHTHPIAVNALLCSPRASLLVEGSLFPDQIVVLGTDPLLVPYIDPGLKLARAVRRMLLERVRTTGRVPKVVYLQNHGMFALGASPAEVLQITEMAVKVAEVIVGSLAAGGPVFLSAADVARIDTRPDELLRREALSAASASAGSASAAPSAASSGEPQPNGASA